MSVCVDLQPTKLQYRNLTNLEDRKGVDYLKSIVFMSYSWSSCIVRGIPSSEQAIFGKSSA